MKKKIQFTYLLVLILLLTDWNIFAQSVFNEVFDFDSLHEGGFSIIQCIDGEFISVGSSNINSPTANGLLIVKIDFKGEISWKKFIDPSPGPYGDDASSVIQTFDSCYIITGTTKDTIFTSYPDIFLLKLNQYGDTIWLKRYGGVYGDYGDAVLQTTDGGFLVLASTYSFSGGTNMDAWLIKTDGMGIMQWDTVLGGTGDDVPEAMISTKDGGYVFTGYKYNTSGLNGIWVCKFSHKLSFEWEKILGKNGETGHGLTQTSDKGYIISSAEYLGGPNDKYIGYIIKTDSLGTKTWAKSYPSFLMFDAIFQVSDGSYVAEGSTDVDSIIGVEGVLMKISDIGNEIWTRYYTKFGGKNNDYLYDMKPTTDGGFVMCGMVTNYGAPTGQDMWLVKTDSCGYTVDNSPQPIATFSIDSLNGKSIALKNTSTNGCSYKWRFGDGDSLYTFNAAHSYVDTGTYTITLYAYAGDQIDSVSLIVQIYITREDEFSYHIYEEDFRVYSDPTNSSIKIRVSNFEKYGREHLKFELIDLMGRKIEGISIYNTQSIIDNSGLSNGVYFYKIRGRIGMYSCGKLIIVK